MFHARLFSESKQYRDEQFTTSPTDRPLIVQFCANDPQHLLNAAKLVENDCDAVDLNLGCPQHIAKRGFYGSFLMDEPNWPLISSMVEILHKNLSIPVTCKIRVFEDPAKTIRYAKMLEEAGCQLLVVHGRTREMKGHKTGLADWQQIKTVKEALRIPVIANGNILYDEDVDRCLESTGVDGVMSAEGNLYNPALFSGKHYAVWKLAEEYLQICRDVPHSANIGAIRGHLFKIYAPCLHVYTDLRSELATTHTLEGFMEITEKFKEKINAETGGLEEYVPSEGKEFEVDEMGIRKLPNWVCQPHLRPELPSNGSHDVKKKEKVEGETADGGEVKEITTAAVGKGKDAEAKKRPSTDSDQDAAEKLAQKKGVYVYSYFLPRNELIKLVAFSALLLAKRLKSNNKAAYCTHPSCANIGSAKCSFHYCKSCCRAHGHDALEAKLQQSNNEDGTVTTASITTPSTSNEDEGTTTSVKVDSEAKSEEVEYICETHKTKRRPLDVTAAVDQTA
jgi:tRNA-dihydrouridine synthase 1